MCDTVADSCDHFLSVSSVHICAHGTTCRPCSLATVVKDFVSWTPLVDPNAAKSASTGSSPPCTCPEAPSPLCQTFEGSPCPEWRVMWLLAGTACGFHRCISPLGAELVVVFATVSAGGCTAARNRLRQFPSHRSPVSVGFNPCWPHCGCRNQPPPFDAFCLSVSHTWPSSSRVLQPVLSASRWLKHHPGQVTLRVMSTSPCTCVWSSSSVPATAWSRVRAHRRGATPKPSRLEVFKFDVAPGHMDPRIRSGEVLHYLSSHKKRGNVPRYATA